MLVAAAMVQQHGTKIVLVAQAILHRSTNSASSSSYMVQQHETRIVLVAQAILYSSACEQAVCKQIKSHTLNIKLSLWIFHNLQFQIISARTILIIILLSIPTLM